MASCRMTTDRPSGLSSITVPLAMNDREFVASPPEDGKDPADIARLKISRNKANGNVLIRSARSLIFYGHDSLFLTSCSSIVYERSRIRQPSDPIKSLVQRPVQVREVDRTTGRRIGDEGGPIGQSQIGGTLDDITEAGIRRVSEPELPGRHRQRLTEQHRGRGHHADRGLVGGGGSSIVRGDGEKGVAASGKVVGN